MRDTTTPTTSTPTPEDSEAVSESALVAAASDVPQGRRDRRRWRRRRLRRRDRARPCELALHHPLRCGRRRSRTPGPPPRRPPRRRPPASPIPAGWTEHDVAAREKVRRFVGNLAGPLGMSEFVGEPDRGPGVHQADLRQRSRSSPRSTATFKVFDLTIDEMDWQIDAQMPPVKALGYNKTWPGPLLRVTQGDKVRANFTNNLPETTGVHFHGVEFDDWYHGRHPVRDPAARSSRARRSPTSSRRATPAP